MSKQVLVCGGRDYEDVLFVTETLDSFHSDLGIELLIHGGQKGADSLADMWAEENGVFVAKFPIYKRTWVKVGRKAGPMRNRVMLELRPNIVIAFPGGYGTADMIKAAKGIPVVQAKEHQLAVDRGL